MSSKRIVSKNFIDEFCDSVKGAKKGIVIPYRSERNNNVICFVHGFCGDPKYTFDPLPELILHEREFDGWDMLSIGYSSDIMPNIGKGIWAANPDINKIANYLVTNLNMLFKNYNRVALIGHSMGGLVIQRAILNIADLGKISHVLFFGTPSGGLKKAWFLRWFNNQINDMDNEGCFIKRLRKEWDEKFGSEYPFKFATIAGELDEFVPTSSSLDPFPEQHRSYTAGNHITMVKPKTENDTSFQIIKNILHLDSNYLKGFDQTALNNLVGKYHEDVNILGKRLKELDNRGFRKYIFALEGTGKIDIAIKAIEQSNVIQTNTDVMGILGGRLKRKYLLENNLNHLHSAIHWYEKALSISTEGQISNQIYYHAINLAFLYLMRDESNLEKSKEMAQLALDNCKKCSNDDCWEIATMAEAYLYLNNFTESQRLYSEAIQKCNKDIRAMSSMMINAFYACNGLNKNDWKNKLEKIFIE